MMQLILPLWHAEFADELDAMHRLRYRVFKKRLDWNVGAQGDREIDPFDALEPAYLLLRGPEGSVDGCVRLLPTTGPTMLRDRFAGLLVDRRVPEDARVWESSRFALDLPRASANGTGHLASGTYELFAGMIEFGLSRGLTHIVTVTDLRMERILSRAGWPLDRLGNPKTIGKTRAVAGYLEVSFEALKAVTRRGSLDGPVLWAPICPVQLRNLRSS